MIITIQGPAGSGKGTVSRILAEKLGYAHYSAGDFRRRAAAKLGLTLEQFNKLGEKESFTDKDADNWMRTLGLAEDNFIIDSRLGWYFIPHSFKIYLDVNDDAAAQRIFNDNSDTRINATKASSLEEQKRLSTERNKSDNLRYKKIYGIEDFQDPSHYDLIVDTSELNIQEVVERILDYLKDHRMIKAAD